MHPAEDAFSALFENAPRLVEGLRDERAPTVAELIDRAETLAMTLPEKDRLALIDGHPRIGADPSTVSAASFREQGYDRSPPASDQLLADRLARLNEAYEERFGFRFVVFVGGRPRSEIADFLETRLSADRDEELERALGDVFAIARDRLAKMNLPQEA